MGAKASLSFVRVRQIDGGHMYLILLLYTLAIRRTRTTEQSASGC